MNSLSTLHRGEFGIVLGLRGEHGPSKRLADLGFIAGARVEMLRPGQPCIVRLAHARFGLSRSLQNSVIVALAGL